MAAALDLGALLDPPLWTGHLPGIGGVLRARPEDFVVVEIPAYEPDGRDGGHVMLTMRKRGWTTEDALVEIARHAGLRRGDLGAAGMKDRHAVTEQWISAPHVASQALAGFSHPDIQLGPAHAHGNKLRRGHLRGNRFEIVVREPAQPVEEAASLARAKLDALRGGGGLPNLFGPQRFGAGGRNAAAGLQALATGETRNRFVVSAGQSVLFNSYLLERRDTLTTALRGDILKKTDTGGIFTCEDPIADQPRLDGGAVLVTGPIFGGKMRAPPRDSPADILERQTLERHGLAPTIIARLGRRAPGSRRPLVVRLDHVDVRTAPPAEDADLGPGIYLGFTLPPGSYATVLCREVCGIQEGAQGPGEDGADPDRANGA